MKAADNRDQMNVVIVGHVDHGKSTLVGRLLADTGSLPEGKLEAVKRSCERNSKPFEYAFLLDALKDEQSQGITIDTARCFFKSASRDYIIIDAPGHIEFLKNMVSGAARAEAAVLLIDAHEGIRENSKRHGYMMSFLGIKNVTVCVNKMDLVGYSEDTFEQIKTEYSKFLKEIDLRPRSFIPISAREGDNVAALSKNMPWHTAGTVLDALDAFEKAPPKSEQMFRMPVQDIYKFTQMKDDRRIVSGRVESGTITVGEEVVFLPSNKSSRVKTVEGFNTVTHDMAFAGQSTGFTLETQIYIRPGDIMCRAAEKQPYVSTRFKANVFWMGKAPLVKNKTYKLKLASQQVPVVVSDILGVLDASELSSISGKQQVDRHDVAECVFETFKPIAFDKVLDVSEMGRFVIVDNYEISGGGIILENIITDQSLIGDYVKRREQTWVRSEITPEKRAFKLQHKSVLVLITGEVDAGKQRLAKAIEERLFEEGKAVYFLGVSNRLLHDLSGAQDKTVNKVQQLQQLGEMAHVLTDAGMILVTSVSDIDAYELNILRELNKPAETIVINVGENRLSEGAADLVLVKNEALESALAQCLDVVCKYTGLDPEYTI